MNDKEESPSQRRLLGTIRGGILDISGKNIRSLYAIGVQPALKVLICSDNHLTSFESLRPQPNLEKIIANNNPLENLEGLSHQIALKELDISQCELSKTPNFRYLAIATIGQQLDMLNSELITQEEKSIANDLRDRPEKLLALERTKQKFTQKSESERLQFRMYADLNKQHFKPIARNEIYLKDIVTNGQLPYIDSRSSREEYIDAIINLKIRNEKLSALLEGC